MKHIYYRKSVSILLLVAVIFCTVLTSCAKNTDTVTFKNDKGKTVSSLSESFMYFWISMQKTIYQSVADSYENGWAQVIDDKGTTLEDLLMTETEVSAKKLVCVEYMHDEIYKIELSKEQKDSIKSQTSKLSEQFGSKQNFEEKLSLYGADISILERYFELMLKQTNVYNLLYGDNGQRKPDESEIADFFEQNYAIISHIFFDLSPVVKEDGTSYSLSEQEISAKRATAQNVYNQLVSIGADFNALKEQFTEDKASDTYYPKGFFVSDDGAFPTDFTNACLNLSAGQIAIVETSGVGIHIIKKEPMDKSLYNLYQDVYMNMLDTITTEDFSLQIDEYMQNASIDRTVVEKFNPSRIPAFSLN